MSPASDQHTDPSTDAPASAKVVRPAALLESLLEPVVTSMGYELVHTEFSGSGKHRRLIVYLDRPPVEGREGGISLSDCSRMSPIISSTLDAAEADPQAAAVARVLAAPYILEVSSPGLDRPLAKLSHFRRHIGGRAKITTFAPLEAGSTQKNFNGRIEDVQPAPHAHDDGDGDVDERVGTVTLVDPDQPVGEAGRHVISLDQIRRAHLVYEG